MKNKLDFSLVNIFLCSLPLSYHCRMDSLMLSEWNDITGGKQIEQSIATLKIQLLAHTLLDIALTRLAVMHRMYSLYIMYL